MEDDCVSINIREIEARLDAKTGMKRCQGYLFVLKLFERRKVMSSVSKRHFQIDEFMFLSEAKCVRDLKVAADQAAGIKGNLISYGVTE